MSRIALAAVLAFALPGCEKKSAVHLRWSLDGQSCARASVLFVRATIDGAPPRLLPCTDDHDQQGAALELPPGHHTVGLDAVGVGGARLWAGQPAEVDLNAGAPAELEVTLSRTATDNPLLPSTPAMKMENATE